MPLLRLQTAVRRLTPRTCNSDLAAVKRAARAWSTQHRHASFSPKVERFERFETASGVRNPLDYVNMHKAVTRRNQVLKKRIAACGLVIASCIAAQVCIVMNHDETIPGSSERLDAGPGQTLAGEAVIVQSKPGNPSVKLDEAGHEFVETGTSTIPHFPKFIHLPSSSPLPSATSDISSAEEQYSLLGLGIRTVSFLSIQVYVLGLYVRTADFDRLQSVFVKHVNPAGSSLIPSEKTDLRAQLLDASGSLDVWDKVLRDATIRSAVRIVPTRNTDFAHLRDGWVRGITARTQEAARTGSKEYEDETFGTAMKDFKALFGGRGKAPKGSVLTLTRDENGTLSAVYETESKTNGAENAPREVMGKIRDERISRLVWLGYLGGKAVSSEEARKNVVQGVMELVERPVGTVGTQVV